MAYENKILLGRIAKVSGYEGAVTVKLEKIFTENIPQMESAFLEIEGRPVPFFISDLEYNGADVLKLSFEGYNSVIKVTEFIGCRIFLTSDSPGENKVYTSEDIQLGSISDVISNNGQWLLNLTSKDKKSILIPFHEDLIIRIDKKKKIVVMDIPDGLLDIN